MRLSVNGEPRDVSETTLDAVLVELGYGGARVATAVDGTFVPGAARAGCRLDERSVVEILAPTQGG